MELDETRVDKEERLKKESEEQIAVGNSLVAVQNYPQGIPHKKPIRLFNGNRTEGCRLT